MKNPKDGLGLENLGDLSSLLEENENTNNGKPLNIDISLIDEDPEQPRTIFSKATLKEMADSIKTRGVKTPISVRVVDGGRYMINHGARRFRASILAKKTTIPAFIDLDYSKADQVIENLHRDNLTPREIAEFIGRQISVGQKKGEIAKDLGKSGSFVTQHHTLLNLPDELAELYNSGRCNDVTVIYEFAVAYKKNKDEVIAWIESNTGEYNRTNIKLFKDYIAQKDNPEIQENTTSLEEKENKQLSLQLDGSTESKNNQDKVTNQDQEEARDNQDAVTNHDPEKDQDNQDAVANQDPEKDQDNQDAVINQDPEKAQEDRLVNGVIIIKFEGKEGEILLDRIPSDKGYCWVEFEDGVVEIKMSGAKFVSLIEG